MADSKSNPCVLLLEPKKASISQDHLAVPNLDDYPPDHVLLRIGYVGVCGSDVHFYLHGGVGSDPRKYVQHYSSQDLSSASNQANGNIKTEKTTGLVMGHEASATVIQTGSSVTNLKVGDKVGLEPGPPCRTCARCIEGNYNLCFHMRFAASFYEDPNTLLSDGTPLIRSFPGTLSRYYVLPSPLCHRLPPQTSLKDGPLLEPLAVGVHAARLANLSTSPQSATVLVTGAGTIGTVSAAVACAYGASRVILVDIDSAKLSFAKSWLCGSQGAATRAGTQVDTFLTPKSTSTLDVAKSFTQSLNFANSPGVDVVLETSGSHAAITLAITLLRPGGHMVQTGLSAATHMADFPIMDLSEKEIHLHGAFRYKSIDFEVAADLLGRGMVGPVGELVCGVFELEDFEEAWKATAEGRGAGKGVKNLIRVCEETE